MPEWEAREVVPVAKAVRRRRRNDWPRHCGGTRLVAVADKQTATSGRDVVRLEIVDLSGVDAIEPPFVGEPRHELVERLLADFDHISQSGTPRWWSIEERSGWGKTRIVQELYRRLAADRQSGAKYWPPSLLPQASVVKNAGLSMSMRKRVFPEQVVP